MNSYLAVVVSNDVAQPEEWLSKVLNKYDLHLEVPEYKDYLSAQEVQYLMKYHDYASTLEFLLKQNAQEVRFYSDEQGIYQLSKHNTNWKWAEWFVGGHDFDSAPSELKFIDPTWLKYATSVEQLQTCNFAALLDLSGEWHDCFQFGWSKVNESLHPQKNIQSWDQWCTFFKSKMAENKQHFIISVVYR